MRRGSLLIGAMLASVAVAGPLESRQSVSVGISGSTSGIQTFQNSVNSQAALLLSLENQLKNQATSATGSAASAAVSIAASLQSQINSALNALASSSAGLNSAVSAGLTVGAGASAGTATQADITNLANSISGLTTTIGQAGTALNTVLTGTTAKSSADANTIANAANQIIKNLANVSATVQNFAGSVSTGTSTGTSTTQLNANIQALITRVAQLTNNVTSAFGMGNAITSSSITGANGSLSGTSLNNLINGITTAINNALAQLLGGSAGIQLPSTYPGLTIKPFSITIPGLSIRPGTLSTTRPSTSSVATSLPGASISAPLTTPTAVSSINTSRGTMSSLSLGLPSTTSRLSVAPTLASTCACQAASTVTVTVTGLGLSVPKQTIKVGGITITI